MISLLGILLAGVIALVVSIVVASVMYHFVVIDLAGRVDELEARMSRRKIDPELAKRDCGDD